MPDIPMGSALINNLDILKYIIVGIFLIFAVTSIIRKVFKLALIFALIAVVAYYFAPQISSYFLLP